MAHESETAAELSQLWSSTHDAEEVFLFAIMWNAVASAAKYDSKTGGENMTVDDVLTLLDNVRRMGDRYIARCPAHKDRSPSLSIRSADDRILVFCHAGCSFEAISNAIGLRTRDWFEDSVQPVEVRAAVGLRKQAREAEKNMERAQWARIEEFGNELRSKDMRIQVIHDRAVSGEITEERAMELLEPLYKGYSQLEYEWQQLLEKTK